MPRVISVYYPGKKFPALSVTGTKCELQCDHCRGRYLKSMKAITSPNELVSVAKDISESGGSGFLLSGGCNEQGKVPLDRYRSAISEIKRTTDLKINLHTGFLDRSEAESLVRTGADCFSIDIVQDASTIKNVLHLENGSAAYKETLDALFASKAKSVVPHICLGLASKEGELAALDLVSKYDIDSLIILVFVPTKGTPMEKREGISNDRVIRFVKQASKSLACPLILGCMRPRGNWELEVECIRAGVSGIVLPSPNTLAWAKKEGMGIKKEEICCALHL